MCGAHPTAEDRDHRTHRKYSHARTTVPVGCHHAAHAPGGPRPVQVGLQLVLIALAAVAGYLWCASPSGSWCATFSTPGTARRRRGAPEAELERQVMTIARLVVRTVGAALAVIAVLMALDLFGIDIGPAVAGLGVVGIAVGLGAPDADP